MSSSPKLFFAVGITCAAAVGWFVWPRGESGPAAPNDAEVAEPQAAPAPPTPVKPVVAELPTPESAGVKPEDCIKYPDGTQLPPLNGVTKAPEVSFHRWAPFTKVVRKERDPRTGLEWYVHENGARSTTRLMWRNGVQEAVGEVEMPAQSRPLVDEK